MKNPRLEDFKIHLHEELKDPEFRRMYEMECAKVAIAQKIAELRDKQHLKQSELAKRMNVSQQFVSQLENAERANLTIETLVKIAKSLNRSVKISFTKLTKNNPALSVS